nr:MAG TPA: hypothetical protein [Caudoviricetes sp.]
MSLVYPRLPVNEPVLVVLFVSPLLPSVVPDKPVNELDTVPFAVML